MAANVEARIAEAEMLREDILDDRQQILEYEKRRTNNEDIIKQIKALRAKSKDGAQEKTYVLMGDLFIRHTNAAAETLLVKEQERLAQEIETLRAEINSKNTRLNQLQGGSTQPSEAAMQD